MTESSKKVDAVSLMRSARDSMSRRTACMTPEEELDWLASERLSDPFLERLRERGVQQASARDQAAKKRSHL